MSATFESAHYWEQRYRRDGTSGNGSYGLLAAFKAATINGFIRDHNILSVIEFGCGDGNQLSSFEVQEYTGLDVSPAAIEICRSRFAGHAGKRRFFILDRDTAPGWGRADLVLSLDVIYHLVEDEVFNLHMGSLFDTSNAFVIIYSDNSDENRASAAHVRHRQFTAWIEMNRPDWRLLCRVPNPYPYDEQRAVGSWADFWIYSKAGVSARSAER